MRPATMLLCLATACATLALTSGTRLAAAPDEPAPEKQPHTLYDDGGTLDWRPTLEEAMKVAADRRRLIFIEWGRES